jgi:hypothetical protein
MKLLPLVTPFFMNIYISLSYFRRFSFIMFLMLFWLLTKDPSFFLCLTWATSKRMASADRLILQTSSLTLEVIRKRHNLCYFNYLLKKYHDLKTPMKSKYEMLNETKVNCFMRILHRNWDINGLTFHLINFLYLISTSVNDVNTIL